MTYELRAVDPRRVRMCSRCFTLVGDSPSHDEWHEQLDHEIAEAAGVRGELVELHANPMPPELVELHANPMPPELIDRIVEVVERAIGKARGGSMGHGA